MGFGSKGSETLCVTDETEKLAADKDSDNSSSSNSMPNRASPFEQKQNNLAKPRGMTFWKTTVLLLSLKVDQGKYVYKKRL